jgi:hypothetical protein
MSEIDDLKAEVAAMRQRTRDLAACVKPASERSRLMKAWGEPETTLYCTFCGKSQHEVSKLIAGPGVFICDECVDLCVEIVNEPKKPEVAA